MTSYLYRKIDAFTFGDSMGNPVACIYLESNQTLTDAEMPDIEEPERFIEIFRKIASE